MLTLTAAFVMLMVMMLMFVFMAVAFLIMVVVMVVLVFTAALIIVLAAIATACVVVTIIVVDYHCLFVLMLMVMMLVVVTAAALSMLMVVLMIVAVAVLDLVQLVEQSAVVHSIDHLVVQLVLVHIEDCTHECEVDLVRGSELSVLLHTVAEVCEVKCDSRSVVQCDCALDVSEHDPGFRRDPFSDFEHGLDEPCFRIRVPAADPSGDSGSDSACLFQRCLLSAHFIIS